MFLTHMLNFVKIGLHVFTIQSITYFLCIILDYKIQNLNI